ncbi:hypothetical protein M4951_08670 [Blastopirellula sp. J2-11]|uniref:bestrophin-like domain n=1 Tax=Blastopirellula sp. J2-11 TaxID=2943192 RepID=UPI0021C8B1B5|nr:hypothetical protein [Blastopirellula sp. J2-11]UUO08374.1 hypothetical protein M4951_08670 [Blastopirellula sp. J2-11]
MINVSPLDYVPLWALFFITMTIVLAAAEGGYRLGQRLAPSKPEKEASIGSVVGATVGLLAFMLAFTFGLATSRFDNRRALFQEEVNAIGTAYLRADLLPEAQGSKIRQLLRDYVEVRLEIRNSAEQITDAVQRSEKLHVELWNQAMVAASATPESPLTALFVTALNEVIDLHSNRVTAGVRARIPGTIWFALYLVSILSMASMGYHAGLSGSSRSIATLGMVLSFVIIMMLIADLDRPMEGVLRVNHQSMVELHQAIQ